MNMILLTASLAFALTGCDFGFKSVDNAASVSQSSITPATTPENIAAGLTSTADNVSTSGWYRSNGNVGWYNNTYGGGFYMSDSNWIRTYGSKSMYLQGGMLAVDQALAVGTTTPAASLHVVGTGLFTQTVTAPTFTMTSDGRLKKDVKPLGDQLANVLAMEPVSYYWNALAHKRGVASTDQQIGFVAQDVEKIFPQAVLTAADGYKSINYPALVAPAIQAIKDLQTQNELAREKFESDLAARDVKITSLELRLEKLESAIRASPRAK